MVEPEVNHLSSTNLLESNEKQLVVTKTYAVKWRKNEVDLVELAKRRWVNKMSYRNIATSIKITRLFSRAQEKANMLRKMGLQT